MAEDIASLGLRVDSKQVASADGALDSFAESASRAEGAALGAESAADALAQSAKRVGTGSSDAAAAIERSTAAAKQNATASQSAAQAQRSYYESLARGADQAAKAAIQRPSEDVGQRANQAALDALRQYNQATQGSAAAAAQAAAAYDKQLASLQALSRYASQQVADRSQGLAQAAAADRTAAAQASASSALQQYYSVLRQGTPVQNQANAAQVAGGKSAKELAFATRLLPAQITDIVTSLASGQPAYLVAIQQGGQLRDSFGGFGATLKAIGTIITPTRLAIGGLAVSALVAAKAFNDGQREAYEFNKGIVLTDNAAGTTASRLQAYASSIDDVVGTQRQASEVLAQLAGSGRIADAQLKAAATTAIQLQRTVGISTSETIKNFVALGERPVEASKKLDQQYRYLTASVYRQIQALEDEGRVAEAAALAQATFQSAMKERADALEPRLGTLQRSMRGVKDVAAEMWDAILGIGRPPSAIEEQIASLDAVIERGRSGDTRVNVAAAQRRRDELAGPADQSAWWAQQQAAGRAAQDAAIRDADVERMADRRSREQAERDADARRKSQFSSNLADIQRTLTAETDSYQQQGEELEGLRAARLISESEYFEERRRLIAANATAQTRALQAENASLAQESQRVAAAAAAARAAADSLQGKGSADYSRALDEAARKSTEAQSVQLANAEKIKENSAEITRLKKAEASADSVLAIQEQARLENLARSYAAATAEAQNFLDTIIEQQRRELAGVGQGQARRQFDSGRNSIDDRFNQQRQQLEQARIRGDFDTDPERYDRELRRIDEFHGKVLVAYQNYWEALKSGERDWRNGAREALLNYLDTARNTAGQVGGVISNALKEGENAWVKFVQTGKLSFRSLADSVIADLTRIAFQKLMTGVLGGAAGGGGWLEGLLAAKGAAFNSNGAMAFANGGAFTNSVVSRPTAFQFKGGIGKMGEAGPEAILPLKRTSAGRLGIEASGVGASQPRITIHNYTPARIEVQQVSRDEIQIIAREVARNEVTRNAPTIVAAELDNPNSRMSKSVSRNTSATRRRY